MTPGNRTCQCGTPCTRTAPDTINLCDRCLPNQHCVDCGRRCESIACYQIGDSPFRVDLEADNHCNACRRKRVAAFNRDPRRLEDHCPGCGVHIGPYLAVCQSCRRRGLTVTRYCTCGRQAIAGDLCLRCLDLEQLAHEELCGPTPTKKAVVL